MKRWTLYFKNFEDCAHALIHVGWLAVFFYGVSTLFRSFNPELNFKQFSLV